MTPRPPPEGSQGPWPVQLATLILKKEGLLGLMAISSVVLPWYMMGRYFPKMIDSLDSIARHEEIQTCIITGGLAKDCILTAKQLHEETANAIAKAVETGTFGGWDSGGGYNPKQ